MFAGNFCAASWVGWSTWILMLRSDFFFALIVTCRNSKSKSWQLPDQPAEPTTEGVITHRTPRQQSKNRKLLSLRIPCDIRGLTFLDIDPWELSPQRASTDHLRCLTTSSWTSWEQTLRLWLFVTSHGFKVHWVPRWTAPNPSWKVPLMSTRQMMQLRKGTTDSGSWWPLKLCHGSTLSCIAWNAGMLISLFALHESVGALSLLIRWCESRIGKGFNAKAVDNLHQLATKQKAHVHTLAQEPPIPALPHMKEFRFRNYPRFRSCVSETVWNVGKNHEKVTDKNIRHVLLLSSMSEQLSFFSIHATLPLQGCFGKVSPCKADSYQLVLSVEKFWCFGTNSKSVWSLESLCEAKTLADFEQRVKHLFSSFFSAQALAFIRAVLSRCKFSFFIVCQGKGLWPTGLLPFPRSAQSGCYFSTPTTGAFWSHLRKCARRLAACHHDMCRFGVFEHVVAVTWGHNLNQHDKGNLGPVRSQAAGGRERYVYVWFQLVFRASLFLESRWSTYRTSTRIHSFESQVMKIPFCWHEICTVQWSYYTRQVDPIADGLQRNGRPAAISGIRHSKDSKANFLKDWYSRS